MKRPRSRLCLEQLEERIALNAGDLDPTFDGDGKVLFSFSFTDSLTDIALQADGKIVAGGSTLVTGPDQDFALARFNTDGSLDTTFGVGGRVRTDFGTNSRDAIRALALQTDGKIVAAGSAGAGIALARYNTDGSLDLTFGNGGKVTTDVSPGADNAYDLAVLADGKIVVVGSVQPSPFSNVSRFAVLRYNSGGSLDTSFGTNGVTTTSFGPSDASARGLVIQADGKIVAAGQKSTTSGNFGLALARYTAGGQLDTTFDDDGLVSTDFPGDFESGRGVALQADGKIVVVGGVRNPTNFSGDIILARYNPDGRLDTSFDGDGRVSLDIGSGNEAAEDVVIQADGRIVVVGGRGAFGPSNSFVARFNADGGLDASFGSPPNTVIPGVVITDMAPGDNDGFSSVLLQPDAKIVAAGTAGGGSIRRFGLARYEGTGLPPAADAGGPYSVAEGGTVRLDGSASTDPEGSALVYAWDLDGDGVFGETGADADRGDETGSSPSFSAAGLDGPSSVTVVLRVTDAEGLSDTATAVVSVTNVPPVITSFTSSSPDGGGAASGEAVTFSAGFTDAGTPDTHTAVIDWGDGSAPESVPVTESGGTGAVAGTHVYSQGGIFTATITITDDDGGSDSRTTTVVVAGVGLNGAVVQVIGTNSDDRVRVKRRGSDQVEVILDTPSGSFSRTFDLVAIHEILVKLFGGSDQATLASNVQVIALIDGGTGTDTLEGGGGSNVLLGGGGDDYLTGGSSRDVLIGGNGADVFRGGGGEDLLIAGRTAFDANPVALQAILAEWNSDRDYSTRMANIRGTGSGDSFDDRLNGDYFLKVGAADATVFDDGVTDDLRGDRARDWFFANVDLEPFDLLRDRDADESIVDVG